MNQPGPNHINLYKGFANRKRITIDWDSNSPAPADPKVLQPTGLYISIGDDMVFVALQDLLKLGRNPNAN